MEVGDQPGDGGALRIGLDHDRHLDLLGPLAQGRESRPGIGDRIDHDRGPLRLDLDARPAQPAHPHLSPPSLSDGRTVYHSRSMPRRSQAAVAETKAAVTETAVDRASVEGLEGLTIGGLADEVEMRKSSLFSLFGSKEELQLATLDAAIRDF